MAGNEVNISEDWTIVRGSTATYQFLMEPWPPAVSAVMTVTGAGFGPFNMTVTNGYQGAIPTVTTALTLLPNATSGYTPGVYPYQILMTMADGSVWPVGTGSVVVQ
jgi:hypothetical protein